MRLFINNPLVIWMRRTLNNTILTYRHEGLTIKQNAFIEKSTLGSYNYIGESASLRNSIIGDYSYMGENAMVGNSSIGRFCSIGPDAKIGLGVHPTDFVSTHPVFYANKKIKGYNWTNTNRFEEYQRVEIASDVWIGANAFIRSGVKVGIGAIIASGAVVTKDIPPFAIVGGVPAKVIRYRFTEEEIAILLKSKWWEKDLIWLKENVIKLQYFHSEGTQEFLKRLDS